jgi:NAD(P)H-quinone oxidoreductase subunit I
VAVFPFEHYGKGIAKGMAVTFKHFARKWITTQYPEQKLNMSRRIRGTDIIWVRETCIACQACARACPVGCIDMQVSRGEDKKLKVDFISIDFSLCIFCGLCIEPCPPGNAIYMSHSYERTTYRCTDISAGHEGLTPSDKRCKELLVANEDLEMAEGKRQSAYGRPDEHEKLPRQTLLLEQQQYLDDMRKKWG